MLSFAFSEDKDGICRSVSRSEAVLFTVKFDRSSNPAVNIPPQDLDYMIHKFDATTGFALEDIAFVLAAAGSMILYLQSSGLFCSLLVTMSRSTLLLRPRLFQNITHTTIHA